MEIKKNDTEFCVSCGVDTNISVYLHIDYRHYYIEGAGQFCKECSVRIYKTENKDDIKFEK